MLVGMGFKAQEARMAIAKLPPSASKVALGDQVKAALANLSK
jgi:Holliday junction resolvasome RuvABC DNA-binding subunit